jgi:hypothetical protein
MSFAAVLSTVQATANTVTSTVDAANKSVGMLTAFVDKAAAEQKIRHLLDGEEFIDRLLLEKAESTTLVNLRAEKFASQSNLHREHFNAALARYSKLVRPEEAVAPVTQ